MQIFNSNLLLNRLLKEKLNIGFAFSDSGGSNQLLYLAKNLNIKYSLNVISTNPGKKIWEYSNIDYNTCENISDFINLSDIIITGTGKSNFEHKIRKISFNKGIYTIAILDHWVNYTERFNFDNYLEMPNEIWVTDVDAFRIAKNLFTMSKIFQIENHYYNFVKSNNVSRTLQQSNVNWTH